jgi:microcystin-dependent protein
MSDAFLGEIRLFAFQRVPAGWLACNGAQMAISTYPELFQLLGTTFGGDGVSTFALPDLRGRVPIHAGTVPGGPTYLPGQTGGLEQVTLLPGQIPAHGHEIQASTSTAGEKAPGGHLPARLTNDTMYSTDLGGSRATLAAAAVGPVGGQTPHDNLMPTLTVNACICHQGIYPQPN